MDIYLPAVLEVIPLGSRTSGAVPVGFFSLSNLMELTRVRRSAALIDEGIAIGIPCQYATSHTEICSGDLLMENLVGHLSGAICRRRLDVFALIIDGLVEARILQLVKVSFSVQPSFLYRGVFSVKK